MHKSIFYRIIHFGLLVICLYCSNDLYSTRPFLDEDIPRDARYLTLVLGYCDEYKAAVASGKPYDPLSKVKTIAELYNQVPNSLYEWFTKHKIFLEAYRKNQTSFVRRDARHQTVEDLYKSLTQPQPTDPERKTQTQTEHDDALQTYQAFKKNLFGPKGRYWAVQEQELIDWGRRSQLQIIWGLRYYTQNAFHRASHQQIRKFQDGVRAFTIREDDLKLQHALLRWSNEKNSDELLLLRTTDNFYFLHFLPLVNGWNTMQRANYAHIGDKSSEDPVLKTQRLITIAFQEEKLKQQKEKGAPQVASRPHVRDLTTDRGRVLAAANRDPLGLFFRNIKKIGTPAPVDAQTLNEAYAALPKYSDPSKDLSTRSFKDYYTGYDTFLLLDSHGNEDLKTVVDKRNQPIAWFHQVIEQLYKVEDELHTSYIPKGWAMAVNENAKAIDGPIEYRTVQTLDHHRAFFIDTLRKIHGFQFKLKQAPQFVEPLSDFDMENRDAILAGIRSIPATVTSSAAYSKDQAERQMILTSLRTLHNTMHKYPSHWKIPSSYEIVPWPQKSPPKPFTPGKKVDLSRVGFEDSDFERSEMTEALAPYKEVDIAENPKILGTVPFPFSYALTELRAAYGKMRSVKGLGKLIHLQVLDLSHNELTALSEGDTKPFATMTQLTELNVSHNQLQTLGEIAGNLMLKKLNASHNQLQRCSSFASLQLLEDLNVSANQLTTLSDLSFLHITMLKATDNPLQPTYSWDSVSPNHLDYLVTFTLPNITPTAVNPNWWRQKYPALRSLQLGDMLYSYDEKGSVGVPEKVVATASPFIRVKAEEKQ